MWIWSCCHIGNDLELEIGEDDKAFCSLDKRGTLILKLLVRAHFTSSFFLNSSHIILNRRMTVLCLHWENKTSSACTVQLAYYVWLLSETRSSTWIIKAVPPEDLCIQGAEWHTLTKYWKNRFLWKKVNHVFFCFFFLRMSLSGTVSCPGFVQLPLPPFRSLTKIQTCE